jgi:hypothetical protein
MGTKKKAKAGKEIKRRLPPFENEAQKRRHFKTPPIITIPVKPEVSDEKAYVDERLGKFEAAHGECELMHRKSLEFAREAGTQLLEIQAVVGKYGVWGDWVAANTKVPYRTCARYMRIAKHWHIIEAHFATLAECTFEQVEVLIAQYQKKARELRHAEMKKKYNKLAAPNPETPLPLAIGMTANQARNDEEYNNEDSNRNWFDRLNEESNAMFNRMPVKAQELMNSYIALRAHDEHAFHEFWRFGWLEEDFEPMSLKIDNELSGLHEDDEDETDTSRKIVDVEPVEVETTTEGQSVH